MTELVRIRLGNCWARGCRSDAYVRVTVTSRETHQSATGLVCDSHEAELCRNPRLEVATEALHSDDPGEFAAEIPETMTPARFEERVRQLTEETAAPPDSMWFLSFADPELPKGERFLGACIVVASSLPEAMTRSHALGINPGGEVATVGPFPPHEVPAGYPVEELLSREMIDKLDERL